MQNEYLNDKGLREELRHVIRGLAPSNVIDNIVNELLALLQPKIEEARRQERERIAEWGNEDCPHVNQGDISHTFRRECKTCWQALKE